jgi:hypothetical protein
MPCTNAASALGRCTSHPSCSLLGRSQIRLCSVAAAAALCLLLPVTASAQIKSPGAHPAYAVELEPHVIVQWANEPYWSDEGFGLGLRATIPFLDNGPVRTINNNMGIGFGLDVAFFDDCDDEWYWRYWDRSVLPSGWDCSAQDWMLPVVVQWNFFFTPVVSVAAEAGLNISYERISAEGPCSWEPDGWCEGDDSDVDLEPLFWGGGRFLFGNTVGLMVRLGTPYISLGMSILI